MAEIIKKTYVEYLPDGTKRDRYRKEYIQQIKTTGNVTNEHATKRKRGEEAEANEKRNKKLKRKK